LRLFTDGGGLKARFLRRFKKEVDRFYATAIEDREYALDVTKKYQKRFVAVQRIVVPFP